MSKQHVFKSPVIHGIKDKRHSFVKGQACPDELLSEMQAKGLVEALPEPVKPVEPKHEAPKK